jgi:proliferating cell nuclear antigen
MSGDGSVESMFSLEYLDDIFSPVDSDTPVTMDIGSEFPVILNYQTESDIAVKNLVAPRIQG